MATGSKKVEWSPFSFERSAERNLPEQVTLEQIEQEHIRRVLALAPTLEAAAATLDICIATLWRKRKRYHLDYLAGPIA